MNKYDRSDRVSARIDHRHDHTRFQLRGCLLNIKSRLFARKMAAVLGMIITPFDKMQTSRGRTLVA